MTYVVRQRPRNTRARSRSRHQTEFADLASRFFGSHHSSPTPQKQSLAAIFAYLSGIGLQPVAPSFQPRILWPEAHVRSFTVAAQKYGIEFEAVIERRASAGGVSWLT